jgi:hypothetical protein
MEMLEEGYKSFEVAFIFVQAVDEHSQATSAIDSGYEVSNTVPKLFKSPIWRVRRIRSSELEVQVTFRGNMTAKVWALV